MSKYIVSVKNYINKQNIVVDYPNSLRASYESFLDTALNYIYSKQGDLIKTDDLFFDKYDDPEIRNTSVFYIRKSNDPNKIYVVEKKKNYGYLYNDLTFIKHLRIELIQVNWFDKIDFNNDYAINDQFRSVYTNFLALFKDHISKNDLPKIKFSNL